MKLSKDRIHHIAEVLAFRLPAEGYFELSGSQKTLIEELNHAITEELLVEDRLNAEIRELMKSYQAEIERERVDYQKMFTMIKKKLVKERGLIL